MNAQPDLFGIHWIKANEQLPAPGKRVMCIYHSHDDGRSFMDVRSAVNDCCGDKNNPWYGTLVRDGLLYWAEQPFTPIEVLQ